MLLDLNIVFSKIIKTKRLELKKLKIVVIQYKSKMFLKYHKLKKVIANFFI